MIDGTKVYVGASDNNVHALDVASHTDSAQISSGLKDPSGNAVAPNLVVVLPK
jgi:YVTN family beta-propeller protein